MMMRNIYTIIPKGKLLRTHYSAFCQQKTQTTIPNSQPAKERNNQLEADNHFGFQTIPTASKQPLVNEVFNSVANKYDIMNDLMSMGIHRYWKAELVKTLGNLAPDKLYTYQKTRPTIRVLDVAGGTGDISLRILENHGYRNVKATVLDINLAMLQEGKKRAESMKLGSQDIEFVCANAEELPFPDATFDAYTISFGLRNVPRTRKALQQALRVLKFGGRFLCLQFSKVQNQVLKELYKAYSFNMIPSLGHYVTGDKHSYQYLVESIQRFLTQQQLLAMIDDVGFSNTSFENYTNGVVAIHSGYKLI